MIHEGTSTLQTVLLLPVFLTIESARVALWATRAAYEPDPDGGLLRALFALVIGMFAAVPSPVWAVVTYALCVAWVPVRGVLWMWGIGRGTPGVKKGSPTAVTRWYTHTRERWAKTLRRRGRGRKL